MGMPVTRNFFPIENILFLAEIIVLLNLKITYIYTTFANFKRDFPKINLKIYLLLQILSLGLETSYLCFIDYLETSKLADFWFRPQSTN